MKTQTIRLVVDRRTGREHDFKLYVSRWRLAGTDDTIARVAIDRAAPLIGGIWITYRLSADEPARVWEEHGDAQALLNGTIRGRMCSAAVYGD